MNRCVFSCVIFMGFVACSSVPLKSEFRTGVSIPEGNLVEGDIIELRTSSLSKNLVRNSSQLWPNKIFPYKFSNDFDDLHKFNVETAIIDLSYQTCVKFRERTNEPNYVVFKSYARLCASVVGYTDLRNIGGEMPIYVSKPGCEMRGQIQHEILHSLGFWHEHTRPDRNEHVIINWDNIQPEFKGNFDARTWSDTQTLNMPYDHDSVMHYSEHAFTKDGSATITPISNGKNLNMGQRFRVSKLDIAKLNRLYDCDDRYYKGNDISG